MKQYLQRQMTRLEQRLPVPQVILLPGDLFYCHSIEIPVGTPEAEVGGFARLQLEAAAPFPIESLAWGFVRHGLNRALVYAATMDRLARSGAQDLGDAWQVMPGFTALCTEPVETAQVRFASCGQSISALFFNAGESVPWKVVSRPLPAGTDVNAPPALLAARAALLGTLGRDLPMVEPGLWRCTHALATGADRMHFHLQRIAGDGTKAAHPTPPQINGQRMWDADVRGRTFAAQAQRQRRQGQLVWYGFTGALFLLLALIVGQVSLWGVRLATGYMQAKAESRRAQVDLLESKASFAENLESITERELKPFAMLAAATATKPAEIHFERVQTLGWNVLRLTGQAGRAEQITQYIETLRGSAYVEAVREVRTESRGGRTSFDFEVVFQPLADIAPLTPKPVEEPPVDGAPMQPVTLREPQPTDDNGEVNDQ